MIGNYKHTIDSKSRLTIPSKFRNELGSSVFVSLGLDNVIDIRTKEVFEKMQESLLLKGEFNKNARIVQRTILGNSFEITFDKQGRILMPKELIERVSLTDNVQIIGVGNKLEIYSADK
jgi:MraZ protein